MEQPFRYQEHYYGIIVPELTIIFSSKDSFVFLPTTVSAVKDPLKSLQTLWFVLAFTSIGLETKFSDIFNSQNQRPLVSFLLAQLFNIIITLIAALVLFG